MATAQLVPAAIPGNRAYHGKGVGWSQTVPRELVHRAALSEVLLTDSVRVDDDEFVVGAQWPRAHSFYGPDIDGRHDPMLVAETLRQAGLLLGHRYYNVPSGHQFIMRHLGFMVDGDLHVGTAPTELSATLSCSRMRRSAGGQLRSTELAMRLWRGTDPVAQAWATMACVSPELWDRLQGTAPPTDAPTGGRRLDAVTVGRAQPADVLLWAVPGAGDSFALRCDPAHPVLFDHPLDHVPGMAQLEAFRQAATVLAAGSDRPVAPLLRLEATFEHAVGLDGALWCSATGSSTGEVRLRLHTGTPDSGETVSSAVLAW